MQAIRTGRALQLEGLEYAQNKVTIGVKCDGGTKITLAQEADRSGMTLSEYIDTIIASRHLKAQNSQSNTSSHFNTELKSKVLGLEQENRNLTETLKFYELNPILQTLLANYQGRTLSFTDSNDRSKEIKIKTVADVFTILVHSFKTN